MQPYDESRRSPSIAPQRAQLLFFLRLSLSLSLSLSFVTSEEAVFYFLAARTRAHWFLYSKRHRQNSSVLGLVGTMGVVNWETNNGLLPNFAFEEP